MSHKPKDRIRLLIGLIILLTVIAAVIQISGCVPADDVIVTRNGYQFLRTPANIRYEEWETPRGMVCVRIYNVSTIECEFPR